MQVDLTNETTQQGRPFLKSGSYTLRILNCEKAVSKKKNPMLVFKYEIVEPEQVVDDSGAVQKIAGMQLTDWIVFSPDNENSRKRLKALNEFCGIPLKLDIDNPSELLPYRGKAVRVQIATEGGVLTDDNTGEPLTDDAGQPITANNYRIRRFLGANEALTIPSDSVVY